MKLSFLKMSFLKFLAWKGYENLLFLRKFFRKRNEDIFCGGSRRKLPAATLPFGKYF